MMHLLDRLFGIDRCDRGTCRDTSEAERRHERAMREGESTLRQAERSIRHAAKEIETTQEATGGLSQSEALFDLWGRPPAWRREASGGDAGR